MNTKQTATRGGNGPAQSILATFGATVLSILERDVEWNATTLDDISDMAVAMKLAGSLGGRFVRSSPAPSVPSTPPLNTGGAFLVVFHDGAEVFSVDLLHNESEAAARVEVSERCNRETGGNVQSTVVPLSLVLAAENIALCLRSLLGCCELNLDDLDEGTRQEIEMAENALVGIPLPPAPVD